MAESAGAERLAFDSDLFPPAERFQRYCDSNGPGVTAREAGPAFHARIARWRLDRTVLHDRHLNDVIHTRTPAHAAADGIDHFMVHVVRSGRYEVDTGDGFRVIAPDQVVLVDMTLPMRSRASDAHVITVSLARGLIVESIGSAEGLHGMRIDRDAGALFVDFAASLARRAATIASDQVAGATRALIALLSSASTERTPSGDGQGLSDADMVRLTRIQRIIEQSLGDPMFGPDAVVVKSGLSRATLYRLLQSRGGLRAYIQRRRLDRVRVALSAVDGRSLHEISADAGFLSESHCSRQFLSAFGLRPGDYRHELSIAQAAGSEPRLGLWLAELR